MDATSGVSGSSNSVTYTTGTGAAGLNESDFYSLLVAQMTHQDPLAPMSNEEYMSQLTQFASLAQLQGVNTNLTYLQMYQASLNNTLAVSLVGKEVEVGTNELELSGGRCNRVWYTLGGDASEVKIRVKDADGSIVREETLGAHTEGDYTVEWDGKDSLGNSISDGTYRVEVVAKDEDGNDVSVSYGIRAKVTGIAFEDGVTYLILNDQKVPLSDINKIHQGESTNDE